MVEDQGPRIATPGDKVRRGGGGEVAEAAAAVTNRNRSMSCRPRTQSSFLCSRAQPWSQRADTGLPPVAPSHLHHSVIRNISVTGYRRPSVIISHSPPAAVSHSPVTASSHQETSCPKGHNGYRGGRHAIDAETQLVYLYSNVKLAIYRQRQESVTFAGG